MKYNPKAVRWVEISKEDGRKKKTRNTHSSKQRDTISQRKNWNKNTYKVNRKIQR